MCKYYSNKKHKITKNLVRLHLTWMLAILTTIQSHPSMGWLPPAQAAQGPSMASGTSRDGAPTALGTGKTSPPLREEFLPFCLDSVQINSLVLEMLLVSVCSFCFEQ